jgi:hypothetical protein
MICLLKNPYCLSREVITFSWKPGPYLFNSDNVILTYLLKLVSVPKHSDSQDCTFLIALPIPSSLYRF